MSLTAQLEIGVDLDPISSISHLASYRRNDTIDSRCLFRALWQGRNRVIAAARAVGAQRDDGAGGYLQARPLDQRLFDSLFEGCIGGTDAFRTQVTQRGKARVQSAAGVNTGAQRSLGR